MNQLFSGLFSIVGGFVTDWQQGRQNKRDIAKAVADNKIRLAQDTQSNNQAWEMAALEGRDNFLRRISFIAWSTPLLWAAFDPAGASRFFRDSLGALPDWYVTGYIGITGAIWGLSALKSSGFIGRAASAPATPTGGQDGQ
jgi:hypothetical protein